MNVEDLSREDFERIVDVVLDEFCTYSGGV